MDMNIDHRIFSQNDDEEMMSIDWSNSPDSLGERHSPSILENGPYIQRQPITLYAPPEARVISGPFNFKTVLTASDPQNPSFFYNKRLNRIYVNNSDFTLKWSWEFTSAPYPIFVCVTPFYASPDFRHLRVETCVQHRDPENSEKGMHIIRSSTDPGTPGVYYCGGSDPGAWPSLVIAFPTLPADGHLQQHMFNFVCKSSCPTGINRKPLSLAIDLKDNFGNILGRSILDVKISSQNQGSEENLQRGIKRHTSRAPDSPQRKVRIAANNENLLSFLNTSELASRNSPMDTAPVQPKRWVVRPKEFKLLTKDQFQKIRSAIESKLTEAIISDNLLSFNGTQNMLEYGGVVIDCDNDMSARWLVDCIQSIPPLWQGCELTIIPEHSVQKYIFGLVNIAPVAENNLEDLMMILKKQNPLLDLDTWKVPIHIFEELNNVPLAVLVVGIPEQNFDTLEHNMFLIRYKLGKFKFTQRSGLYVRALVDKLGSESGAIELINGAFGNALENLSNQQIIV